MTVNAQPTACPVCLARPGATHSEALHDALWTMPLEGIAAHVDRLLEAVNDDLYDATPDNEETRWRPL